MFVINNFNIKIITIFWKWEKITWIENIFHWLLIVYFNKYLELDRSVIKLSLQVEQITDNWYNNNYMKPNA